MGKKITSLLLALAVVVSCAASTLAVSFSDITEHYDWAKDAINELTQADIIKGYDDGTFKPGNQITKEQCIALFGRMMGCDERLNSVVSEFASDAYQKEFDKLDTYAAKEMAYLIYKQALSTSDITNWLSKSTKDVYAKRYEAATLIAKCLGADPWLKTNPEINVTFADKDSIPSTALGYVQYATQMGIIQGMDDNTFGPMGDVTRAQMAVMLKRMIDLMFFTYTKGNITAIDTATGNVTLRKTDGSNEIFKIVKDVAVMIDGETSPMNLLQTGMEAVVTLTNGRMYSVDAFTIIADQDIEGSFVSFTTDNSKTIIKVTGFDENASAAKSYTLADDAVITFGGKQASTSSFKRGDYVKLSMRDGKAAVVTGESQSATVSGCVLEEIIIDPSFAIKVRTSNNEVLTFDVLSNCGFRKNDAVTNMSALAVGDRCTLSLDYGRVSYIDAKGGSKSVEGELTEIVISKTPSIKILANGETHSYTLSRDIKITLDGTAATVYDLKLGFQVKLTTSSDEIKEITVKSVTPPMSITGEVTLVNAAYNMINVRYTDTNGDSVEKQVFIKSNAKILDSRDNTIKTISKLTPGMLVTVAVTENVGIFEATSVMILQENGTN